MLALEEEKKLNLIRGEGPICLIMTPSVSLALVLFLFIKRELAS